MICHEMPPIFDRKLEGNVKTNHYKMRLTGYLSQEEVGETRLRDSSILAGSLVSLLN